MPQKIPVTFNKEASLPETAVEGQIEIIDNGQSQVEGYIGTSDGWKKIADNDTYSKEAVDTLLDEKADKADTYTKTETDDLLATKADAAAVYTKSETGDLLANKADSDSVYTKLETDNLLNNKADKSSDYTKSETNDLLDDKADKNSVYTKTETDDLLANKADADSVYTKTEADALLATKANAADVYTKSQADTLLADKADKADTYTKTDVDTLLSGKADSSSVYTKQETYSQSEVNILLSGKADSSSVYTKSETDDLLSDKADKATTYTKSEADDLLATKADADAVYTKSETDTLLSGKQNTLTFDTTPTIGSSNPVTSDGIAESLADKADFSDVYTKAEADNLLNEKANTDGYYKEMTVGYAEQLLSTTGVETDGEFITRTTGGSADITSGPVQIKKIKGNTIKWNQLVRNGNFESASGWGTDNPTRIAYSVADNCATIVCTGTGNFYRYKDMPKSVIGHIYIIKRTMESSIDGARCGYGYGMQTNVTTNIISNKVPRVQTIRITADIESKGFFTFFSSGTPESPVTYKVRNEMLFDLTMMFGAGNEPTIDEFNAMFPDAYYATTNQYPSSEISILLSSKPSGMQTDEFNLCSCASIFENTFTGYANDITEHGDRTVINWLKSLQRYNQPLMWEIEHTGATESGSVPIGTIGILIDGYGLITIFPGVQSLLDSIDFDQVDTVYLFGGTGESTTFSNACMHFVWSGSRSGDYEPFRQNTLAINTATYFPNGMRSAGTAYDEMNFETRKAIARISRWNLGDFDWNYDTTNNVFHVTIGYGLTDAKTYVYGDVVNIICAKYPTTEIATYAANMPDGYLTAMSDLRIKDTNYSNPADFKAAMSGVYAYYEVATPIEVPIPEYAQNIYRADDYGTETWLQTGNPNPAAPVGSELFYYANLRDKLQHLPDLASANGNYLIKQTGTQMELEPAPVQSISANGTALTPDADGNVNIPVANSTDAGVVKVGAVDSGIAIGNGQLYLPHPENRSIEGRNQGTGRAITVRTYDYAVKCAMIADSNTAPAWTTSEQSAARARMGIPDTVSESYTIATSDWATLSSSSPYTYSATVTAAHTIGNDTTIELINDQPVLFATNGFAIASVSGQVLTIYSIGVPSASVTLEVQYNG